MNTSILNPVQSLVTLASLATGVAESRLHGTDRSRRVATIRWAVFIVLHRQGWSLAAIGDAFCKDHGTVIHGLRQGNARIAAADRWFSSLVSHLSESVFP